MGMSLAMLFALISSSKLPTKGPYCAGIFDPRAWSTANPEQVTDTITLEFTRIVLAIGVFAIGVELPKAYMAKHWRSLFFLLVPVMTWVCSFSFLGEIIDAPSSL